MLIYPNPASEYIEINFNTFNPTFNRRVDEGSDIQIFDMLGVIQSTPHQFTTPQPSPKGEGVRIDVSSLAPGMYFIEIGNRIEKFVKL
jgi:hypothetical protein